MSYRRTDAHRALRAEMIHRWKPWTRSTGPRTPEGKRRSAMRGYKGAVRPTLRAIGQALQELPSHTAFPLRGSGDS